MRGPYERSVTEVLQDIIGNVEAIVRGEFQLAKTEVKEKAAQAKSPAVTLGVGLFLAACAVGLLLLAAVSALATRMAMWSAALLVAMIVALAAMLLISRSRERLRQVNAKPGRLLASLTENVRWAKRPIE